MNLKACLWDADGCLFEAVKCHQKSLIQALDYYGITLTEEEHDLKYNGLPTRTKLAMLGVPNPKEIEDLKQKLTLELLPKYILPSVQQVDLIVKLSRKYKMAICSNAITASVYKMANLALINRYFDVILGNESVLKNKPHPDIWLFAADKLGVTMKECIIIEDSKPGLESAYAANPGKVIEVTDPKDAVNKMKEFLRL